MMAGAAGLWRAATLWLMTTLALLIAGLAIAEAFAQEPALRPPPAITLPAPANPETAEPEFYIVPASALYRVSEIIENMQREIQRLEAIVAKGSCA